MERGSSNKTAQQIHFSFSNVLDEYIYGSSFSCTCQIMLYSLLLFFEFVFHFFFFFLSYLIHRLSYSANGPGPVYSACKIY
jgi:hypothetical protein